MHFLCIVVLFPNEILSDLESWTLRALELEGLRTWVCSFSSLLYWSRSQGPEKLRALDFALGRLLPTDHRLPCTEPVLGNAGGSPGEEAGGRGRKAAGTVGSGRTVLSASPFSSSFQMRHQMKLSSKFLSLPPSSDSTVAAKGDMKQQNSVVNSVTSEPEHSLGSNSGFFT